MTFLVLGPISMFQLSLPESLSDSGRLIRKLPLIHHYVGGFGNGELIVHQELDRIGAKVLDGDLVRSILDRSLVQNPGFRALMHRLLAFSFDRVVLADV